MNMALKGASEYDPKRRLNMVLRGASTGPQEAAFIWPSKGASEHGLKKRLNRTSRSRLNMALKRRRFLKVLTARSYLMRKSFFFGTQ